MHIRTFTGAAVVCLGLLAANSAMAATPNLTLSTGTGNWAATTCGEFSHLDSTAQANLVTQATEDEPSLTSNSGSTNATDPSASNSTDRIRQPNPLTPGLLISACQAATPSTTLRDAFSAAQPTEAPPVP